MKRLFLLFCLFSGAGFSQVAEAPTRGNLQKRYDALAQQYWEAKTTAQRDKIDAQMDILGDQLTQMDRAALQANDAKLEALTSALQVETQQLDALADKKWCHTNLWRRLWRYKKPEWCGL